MTEEKFFKWATTRWYLYVIVLLVFIYNNSPLDELGSKLKLEPGVILGSVLVSFVISFIITTFIYFIMPNSCGELQAGFNSPEALCNSKQKDLNSGGGY